MTCATDKIDRAETRQRQRGKDMTQTTRRRFLASSAILAGSLALPRLALAQDGQITAVAGNALNHRPVKLEIV